MTRVRAWGIAAVVACATALGACNRHRMTEADCLEVLDRITDLELAESGFRDPALATERRHEMRARFAGDIYGCVGRRARADALACVRRAPSSEALSHECLR